eukprot:s781_g7.t1
MLYFNCWDPVFFDRARCLAPLFYEQVVATLTRCGCQVWHLNADEQSPLLQTRRGSEWSHVWGIVSDNIDWAVCQGVKLIPLQFFDLDGIVKLKSMEGAGMGWPEVGSFSVAYTSSDVIAEYLRLGHPPKEEDLKEYERKGKSKGSFGRRGWPMKWWYDSVLIELALLFGTDATTPFIQKHKLYQQIGLRMGQDPIESITRWFRDQLYSRKLRWKDVYLEALSPVLADLAEKDSDFGLALQCSRKVYEQDARSLRNVVMNLERQRRQNGEKAVAIDSSLHQANQERAKELPVTSSLLLRSAALADKVWLDVHLEDVSRLGAPVSTQLFSDLRRVLYQLLGRDSITETKGDHSGVTASKMVLSDAGSLPDAKAVQRWTWSHRWQMFRAIVEHNLVHVKRKNEKSHPAPEGAESAEPVEIVVHRTFKENQSDDAVPDWAHGSFAAIVLEYVASLNQRPEQPMIREHEFDTLAATLALCCDTALPGAPLGRASAQVQQRMYQVKELLYNHITTHFHANSEIRLPPRGASVATYFQTAAHLLMDIARLLWLDADFGHGSMVFLPEPREIFSAQIFAALYMAGAYEAWELSFPEGDSAWQWEEIMNQLVELRHEVLWCQPFRTWREELLWSLRPGVIAWPTERQLDEERKKSSHVEELPIDEHRDKILKHIETHRVTSLGGSRSTSFFDAVKAKKHQFPWEANDGMFVMGPIGDMLLKKLKEKDVTPTADPRSYSTKSFCSTPVSPSTALRRGKCKIAGSRCKRYNPRLFIPQSLMDGLEIANELKSAANKLLEEAADEVPYGIEETGEEEATGRREILPGIAPHDLAFELEEPMPNGAPVFTQPGRIARFRIKEERWNREIVTAGTESVKGVLKRLSASEFACNMQLLGELREWCDGYRAIKAKRMAQKAFQLAEDRELALQRRTWSQNQPELVERGQLRAKKLGELAAKDVEHTIDSALEICHCGYQEIWHEGPVSFEAPRAPQRRNSRRLSISRSPLEAMAPAHVCSSETSQSPALICTAVRQSGGEDAVLSEGRLSLRHAGASIMAASA